ncbi:hypothetical protein MPRF_22530 [Mycolicibacterium parafortuitum]|uniref:Uncharacterized protein n=1 Tax=Mycolicibacterium parafortuitum TaxID=39692 RepID=A0A7I7U226_MYCPF|nr:hypothetical protein [Mycolicibacterium parafortuitum]BBY75354.1 hypothetical protein MPRF_22530 [Mycolicibacterium parafortuitum]
MRIGTVLDFGRPMAAAAVPDELVHATSLIGDAESVRQRLTVLCDAGVTLVNVTPMATAAADRLDAVRADVALSKEIS